MIPSSLMYTFAASLKPSSIGTEMSWETAFWPCCFGCLALPLLACSVILRFAGIGFEKDGATQIDVF